MARRIIVEKLSFTPADGIPVNGGPIVAKFDGRKARGSGRLKARYWLHPNDPYVFSGEDARKEVHLAPQPVEKKARTYTRKLRLAKVAGGRRLVRVDIELEVEEIDDDGNREGDPTNKVYHVPIRGGTAEAVKALREQLEMSQAELAIEVGVSQSTISRLELGGTPSHETLEKLPKSHEHGVEDLGD